MKLHPRTAFFPAVTLLLALGLCLSGCSTKRRVQINRPLNSHDLHKEEPLYLVISVENAVENAMANAQTINEEVSEVSQYQEYNELFKELLAFRLANAGIYDEVAIAPFGPGDQRKVWQQATFLELRTIWAISGKSGSLRVEYTSTGLMKRLPIDKLIWQGNITNKVVQKNSSQELKTLINQAVSEHVNEIIQGLMSD